MSFTAEWLALRGAADARARNATVARRLQEAFAGRRGLRVLDIGAGTGANLRTTAPLLPLPQHWCLVDHDPTLLAAVEAPEGVTVEARLADLSSGIAPLLDPHPDLITASAFFDLVGAAWLDRFVEGLTQSGAVLYAVLSYVGTEEWAGKHPADTDILAAFHANQRRDKGLGPALGPDAHAALTHRLRAAGYRVTDGSSPWRLQQPRDARLIAALAAGTAAASGLGSRAEAWREARARAQAVTIGHRDLLAVPRSLAG